MKIDSRKVEAVNLVDLNNLSPLQVKMIDEALAEAGEYGEVRLVVEKGRFRFLILQKSFDALNSPLEEIVKEF